MHRKNAPKGNQVVEGRALANAGREVETDAPMKSKSKPRPTSGNESKIVLVERRIEEALQAAGLFRPG
jgi:hypothetical protein